MATTVIARSYTDRDVLARVVPGPIGAGAALAWRRALLLLLGIAVLGFGVTALYAIQFRFELDYGEGPVLDGAIRFAAHGVWRDLYRPDWSAPPFVVANYPPIHLLAQVPFIRTVGAALWYGRTVSCVAAIGAAFAVARTLYALQHDRWAAWIAGLLVLTSPTVTHWAPLNRVDCLALALSWAGIATLVGDGAGAAPGRGRLALGGLALVAAVFTKQTYFVAAPFASLCWLWSGGHRRHAVALATLMAGVGIAGLCALQHVTGGGFLRNVVDANRNSYQWVLLRAGVGWLLASLGAALALAIAYAFVSRAGRDPARRLILPYLAGASISALGRGQLGASSNHLLELSVALVLASAALVTVAHRSARRERLVLGVLCCQVAGFLCCEAINLQRWSAIAGHAPELAAMESRLRETPTPVLLDGNLSLLPLAGRPIELQPFELTKSSHDGVWDQAPLVDLIARRAFPSIWMRDDGRTLESWTPEMLAAIYACYRPAEHVLGEIVYRPSGRGHVPGSGGDGAHQRCARRR